MTTPLKILFYPHIKYKAQFFLRYLWPANELRKLGHEVRLVDPRHTGRWTEEMMAEDFLWSDIVVAFYPKTKSGMHIVEACQQFGKKLIIDVDDFSFAVHPSNIAYGFSGTKDVEGIWRSGVEWRGDIAQENHLRWAEVMRHCDAMTVTTQALADMYAPFVGDNKLWVLPNSLDTRYYKPWKRRESKDIINIGWQGGASHFVDMDIVEEPLIRIQEENNNVQLVFMGQLWKKMKEKHPTAHFHPWVDSDTYQLKLGSLDLDIGICPIGDDLFSRGKSNLKMLEYGAFGVPSVCSEIDDGPYNSPAGADMNWVDRVLVKNDADSWYNALKELVDDEEKRREIGANAKKTVNEVYNIELTGPIWGDCYERTASGLDLITG